MTLSLDLKKKRHFVFEEYKQQLQDDIARQQLYKKIQKSANNGYLETNLICDVTSGFLTPPTADYWKQLFVYDFLWSPRKCCFKYEAKYSGFQMISTLMINRD